ncbi:ABC-2 family transporter [Breznakia blatticola]|uniref:ABC-2 family transporter n=1 Tax=Breznakia blatticola TaxID=1754012 RepID=A0A4R8ABY3_9FIRM|nr:ABC transporter permease [Breznakia blatticola]TDW26000.1 ABC-2 family transporter [Breznakia blatticola]
MFKMIKMDLYRLFRQKSFYFVGLAIAFFAAMAVFSLSMALEYGVYDGLTESNITIEKMFQLTRSDSSFAMIMAIGAIIFTNVDFSSGYIKNIASNVTNKTIIPMSKFIVNVFASFIYIVWMFVVLAVGSLIMFNGISFGNVGNIVIEMLLYLYFVMNFIALVIGLCMLLRSSAGSITILVCIVLFSGLVYAAINYVVSIDLTPYSTIANISSFALDAKELPTMMLSALVGIVGYNVVGAIAMQKKDI